MCRSVEAKVLADSLPLSPTLTFKDTLHKVPMSQFIYKVCG